MTAYRVEEWYSIERPGKAANSLYGGRYGYGSTAVFGYGTAEEAQHWADRLNGDEGLESNLYRVEEVDTQFSIYERLQSSNIGFNLYSALRGQ